MHQPLLEVLPNDLRFSYVPPAVGSKSSRKHWKKNYSL